MFIVGIATAALAASLVRVGLKRRKDRTQSARPSSEGRAKHQKVAVALLASATAVALMVPAGVASAAIVPTVELGTADNYAVLAGSTVTNTGPSVLNRSLGLSPGTSVIGFPPGLVNPPGTIDIDNEVAEVAQLDLTAAYVDAADRPLNFTTNPDLVGLVLVGGVYAAPAHGPLGLTGQLTLDGEGDPNS